MAWYNPTVTLSKPPLLIRSKSLISNSCHFTAKKVIQCTRNYPLMARKKQNFLGKVALLPKGMLRLKVSASSGEEVESGYLEEFSWSSVILPFIFPALGGLLFGYDIGATSGATISLKSPALSGTTWYNLSAVQLGLVVSGSLYGALIGSILAYPFADFLGLGALLLGRLVYGLGIGLAMHGAPLYIAETCPSQIRGTLISLKELAIVLGILLGYFVGSYEIDVIGGWRYMFGLSSPIALLMGIGMWTLPPSPRWLLLRAIQGKGPLQEYKEKAIGALSKLRGRPAGDKVSEKQIEDTIISLKTAYTDEEAEGNFLEVLQGPSLKAFKIGGGLVLFQQITGQPSVLYYAGSILQSAGFSAAADAARVSVVIGIFKSLMTAVAVLKADDLGRRPLLIGGVSGIALSLFLLSAYYKFLGSYPLVAASALLLYVGCYQISFGPISWLMVSEIFPLRTRGKGISLAVLTNFGSNAIVTFAFSPLKELLGAENLFLLFGVIALLSLLFVVTSVPETKGLTLEEIESKILK
ncbi:D-xylose-proton symporter-like 3, chloroplastic isoform X3 [Solanum dulcamara]|uniref:D-xylose-proton symporter-like 3, chloroplastic isoform X3 n=1 Tax=Solanum dulcamara TaxID=45834 RepID=UPI0024869B79|nr:D-xylose-proton symporter-like 3, chloroplastic isoform X3 [Solanum dulcamara]